MARDPLRIDTRGLRCPWPVLRAARAMRAHEAILLLADDPVARTDIPVLAAAHGWSVETRENGPHDEYALKRGDGNTSS